MAYYVAPPFNGEITGNRIVWETRGELLWLEPYGPNVIRFRSTPCLRMDETRNWTLLPPLPAPDVTVTADERQGVLVNGLLTATVTGDGSVTYSRTDTGEVLLAESWIDGRAHTAPLRRAREYRCLAGDEYRMGLYFQPDANEHFYGMGQEANDCFDLKGCTLELCQKNGKCTIPYAVSSKGYGFIWNNPAIGRVEFVNNHTHWYAECSRQLDYLVLTGESIPAMNRTFTGITGRAPQLPDWATGFWQSKLRYETQEELLTVAREYKRRGLPLSVIVIDYFHWTQQGEWKFDPRYWPDPQAMVDELQTMGIRLMVSIWPTMDPRSENYTTMRDHNYLLRCEKGVDAVFMFFGPQTYVDCTHPGAQRALWERVQDGYGRYGIHTFWLDEAEPEMRPYDFDHVRMYPGSAQEVGNLYCVGFAKAFYDGLRAQGKTVCNLVRCAWLGSQRFGVVLWSGDIASTFDSLRKQIKAGLNVSLCGIPWWTTDIGGFLNGDPQDPHFRELLIRWFQFGLFCPIMRLHGFRLPEPVRDILNPDGYCGSGGDNEVWSFGEEALAILTWCLHTRETLRPYIMRQMERASADGTPVLRPLFFDFEADANCYAVDDEYLFGDELLVAPVAAEGIRARNVYLPTGAKWVNAYTGEAHTGGQWLEADAPLARIPVFCRQGSGIRLG